MSVELLTKEDLQTFRLQLLSDLKALINTKENANVEWLRSNEIKKKLKISPGTLQNLRISGKLKPTKIGGIYFYRNSDLEKLFSSEKEI